MRRTLPSFLLLCVLPATVFATLLWYVLSYDATPSAPVVIILCFTLLALSGAVTAWLLEKNALPHEISQEILQQPPAETPQDTKKIRLRA